MDRLKKILSVCCAVFGMVLLSAMSLLAVNTFVGGEAGTFFEPSSALGGICKIISLFCPFIAAVIVFLVGLIFGKNRMTAVFAGAVGVLAVTHIAAPFMTQFVFTNTATNGFTHFLQAFFTVLAMPVNSIPYAFNEAVNLFLTDFSGSRIFVFVATFLTFAEPVLLTAGYLAGFAAKNRQQKQKEISA